MAEVGIELDRFQISIQCICPSGFVLKILCHEVAVYRSQRAGGERLFGIQLTGIRLFITRAVSSLENDLIQEALKTARGKRRNAARLPGEII